MAQRTFLQLTHNPFTPPREGFFTGADRRTHLEHLRHLSQWSRRILLVTGPFGIGKSTLYRELSNSLEPNVKGARLAGTVINSTREVLVGLAQGFGVAFDHDLHADEMAALLCRHAEEEAERERTCMAMLDDAHLLDSAAVNTLVELVARSPMRLVMFAEGSVIGNVDRAVRKHELEWFEIRLTGFTKADVRNYLEWRFAQAQYRGRLPFTDNQLEHLAARSSGNPNVVDFMANELLADMETGQARRRTGGFPMQHAMIAGLLVVLVGLLYLLFQDPVEDTVVQVAELPAHVGPVKLPPAQEFTPATEGAAPEAAAATAADERAVADADAPAGERAVARETPAAAEQAAGEKAPAAKPADTSQADDSTGQLPATQDSTVESANGSDATEPSGRDAEAGSQTRPGGAAGSPSRPESGSAPDTAQKPVAQPQAEATTPAQAARPPASDSPVPVTASAGIKTGSWLLDQNPDHFTAQIVTLSDRQRAVAFIGRQREPQEFALYRNERNSQTFYVVTYGVFSSRAAAVSAVDRLQGELARLKPWIRSMRLVQDTVRATRQD